MEYEDLARDLCDLHQSTQSIHDSRHDLYMELESYRRDQGRA